ncbi:nitroreductase/quinone reductase family protein [Halobium salinum]|uniref:Nitroreductase/quinone reductase family protein n=1 Tax=Halobium salinum TaxID=1364940 RepID=A0ABD5PGJ2_9EURY|nr:nitroreductase/quinone reductase family protein [Halobium salinum]
MSRFGRRALGVGVGIVLFGVVAARRLRSGGAEDAEARTTDTDDPTVLVADPPASALAYRVVNPAVSALLRSPVHGLVSDSLGLITFTGRKTGKRFTTPVGYHELDDGRTLILTHSPWWENLRGGRPVTLRVRGEDREAVATPRTDPDAVADDLRALVEHVGAGNLRRLGLDYEGEGLPSRAALRDVAEKTVILEVDFEVGTTEPDTETA